MAFVPRGATPLHTFEIPLDASMIEDIYITYAQNDIEVIRKDRTDCEFENLTVKTKLTQEETLKLSSSSPVQIQIKILTVTGDVLVSDEIVIRVKKCLNNEVM